MEITGNIKLIQDIESGTSKAGSEWSKRTILLTTEGDYSQDLPIDFWGKSVSALENFQVGNPIKVHFNLKSRENNGKHYPSINGWKIENHMPDHTNADQNPAREETADLPF